MFEFRGILLIILLCVSIYLIYKMYAYNSLILTKATESIIDNIEDQFTDINQKIQAIEEMISNKFDQCNKKVNDLYSMQNKVNEITKMNNQSIINQINQYDEEHQEPNDNDNDKNLIYNSVETVGSFKNPNINKNQQNNENKKCFIKLNDIKNQDKDMFYMSSINNSNKKSTKDNKLFNNNLTNENVSNKSLEKLNNDLLPKTNKNDSDSSTLLEINSEFIKPFNIDKSTKFTDALKILNENTNIIKNSSFNKLSELEEKYDILNKKYNSNSNPNSNSNSNSNPNSDSDMISPEVSDINIMLLNDPPIILSELIKKSYNNKSKIIEIV